MNTEGINATEITGGYKYLILQLDTAPIAIDEINANKISKKTKPIISVGPANNGKI